MCKFISNILTIFALCTLLQSLSLGIKRQEKNINSKSNKSLISKNYYPNTNFRDKELKKYNNDYYGFLEVVGTKINYPVMFSPDSPDFYLEHDFEGKFSLSGLPFVSSDFIHGSKHIIIYAHNMSDGTLFSDLLMFQDKEYFNTHSKVILSREGIEKEFLVLASVFIQLEDSDSLKFYSYMPIKSKLDLMEYIKQVEKYAFLIKDLKSETKELNEVITLSTCSYHVKEGGRFLLIAVR